MFWFVCRKSGLLVALLQRKKVFSQFAASHSDFYLIFTQRNVFVFFLLGYAVFNNMFLRTGYSFFFLPKLRFWPFILPKPSFGLVATELEASSFMSQKAAI